MYSKTFFEASVFPAPLSPDEIKVNRVDNKLEIIDRKPTSTVNHVNDNLLLMIESATLVISIIYTVPDISTHWSRFSPFSDR
jgi:hypothetical protein